MDGLGGLPLEPGGKTELETAHTPNLDALAGKSALGLSMPVGPGITVGSGPGHLALFGYDPIQYQIGRGALEALGVDFVLTPDDLAARGNFCTVDETGNLTDRRAGRIPTELSREYLKALKAIRLEGFETFLEPVKEHRFVFVLRGPGLDDRLTDSDPQRTGIPPLPVQALAPAAERSANLLNAFIEKARQLLADRSPANMITLRGFARYPFLPKYQDIFKLKAAAVAVNAMYRGVARLAGMTPLPVNGESAADEFSTLERYWNDFDFFYMHFKRTDTAGEKGDYEQKVRAIEEVDACIPRLVALRPDVVIVTGDHSSPAVMKAHSWHPVPTLLYGKYVRADGISEFGESACARGNLGLLRAKYLMPLALANARRIAKFST